MPGIRRGERTPSSGNWNSPLAARILKPGDFEPGEAKRFLYPTLSDLPDPFTMKEWEKAVGDGSQAPSEMRDVRSEKRLIVPYGAPARVCQRNRGMDDRHRSPQSILLGASCRRPRPGVQSKRFPTPLRVGSRKGLLAQPEEGR